MNSGIIANRYAKALLKYVRGTEDEDIAYSQASVLVALFQDVPKFRDAVERNPELSVLQRVSLLEAALQAVCPASGFPFQDGVFLQNDGFLCGSVS